MAREWMIRWGCFLLGWLFCACFKRRRIRASSPESWNDKYGGAY